MSRFPVVKNCAYCLVHVPDLVQYGSKPQRESAKDAAVAAKLTAHLRSYADAVAYPPHQTFIGNLTPERLGTLPRPWYADASGCGLPDSDHCGPFGEILDQKTFYGLLKTADILTPPLFETPGSCLTELHQCLENHPLLGDLALVCAERSPAGPEYLADKLRSFPALELCCGNGSRGYFFGDLRSEGGDDENLKPLPLLENLCAKGSGALALKWLLYRENIGPDQIDFLISCGEEACGDRYQRSGGGMAKAIGEMCGCINCAGMDIKNFCAAPASALITAGALVQAGVFDNVVVVGGGSLAKLGMKFQAFVEHNMPILDDTLAAMAFLVTQDDGQSPIIRLADGAVGRVPVGAGTSDEAVFRNYLLRPLERLNLRCTDIDRYALELQNPEIMEFAGSGDVARKNYRKLAAMAVLAGQLEKKEMEAWIDRVGMVGFAPTQGHIPSAVPYLGHALEAMRRGEIQRAMFLSRASLFLNRCTDLLDGVSFVMEQNPNIS